MASTKATDDELALEEFCKRTDELHRLQLSKLDWVKQNAVHSEDPWYKTTLEEYDKVIAAFSEDREVFVNSVPNDAVGGGDVHDVEVTFFTDDYITDDDRLVFFILSFRRNEKMKKMKGRISLNAHGRFVFFLTEFVGCHFNCSNDDLMKGLSTMLNFATRTTVDLDKVFFDTKLVCPGFLVKRFCDQLDAVSGRARSQK